MFCKKGIYVNWGNIPNMEFDFGPVNLFSGGNGSGKSTAADGLQSLMTGTYENLFNFNPGQDETTQRGRGGKQVRTLASYILGCDDGSYARTRMTDGYVAAVFHPTAGESGEPFTAVMCVRASIDTAGATRQARQEALQFLIIPNEQLSLSHFVRDDGTTKYVVAFEEIVNLLKKELGKDSVELYEKKGTYLKRLYGALRGQKVAVSMEEAKHAAKSFSSFMAYKPVSSINDFVAREVLEARDLSDDIKKVSELMKTIHGMEEETRQVKTAIENLSKAQDYSENILNNWCAYVVGQYAEKTRQLGNRQKEYLNLKEAQSEGAEELKQLELKLKNNAENKRLLHEQLVSMEAERQGISALKDKDQLEQDIAAGKQKLGNIGVPFLRAHHQFTDNVSSANVLQQALNTHSFAVDVPLLDEPVFRKKLQAVLSKGDDTGINAHDLMTDDWVGIANIEHKLANLAEFEALHNELHRVMTEPDFARDDLSLRDQLIALTSKKREQQARIHQQVAQKQSEIDRLENKSVNYPAYVEQAIAEIKSRCPQAKPSVLCDFVEITDSEWQMAIEGYIGGDRFSILVEPEFEAEAIQIVRQIKGRRNNAKVIQGAKVQRDAERITAKPDSILGVMTFDNKIAEYYIKAKHGNVLRVPDVETLRSTPRGVTADGLGSGGYSMYRCDLDEGELVFGQGARERAMLAKREELVTLLESQTAIEQSHRQYAQLNETLNKIKPVTCSELAQQMLDVFRQLQTATTQLNNLDLSGFEEIEQRLEFVKQQHVEAEEAGAELSGLRGKVEAQLAQLQKNCQKLSEDIEQLQDDQEVCEKGVLEIPKMFSGFDTEVALSKADEDAQKRGNNFSFDEDNEEYLQQIERMERSLCDVVMLHNQSNNASTIHYMLGGEDRKSQAFFKGVIHVKRDVDAIYNGLKNNILIDKHEKLTVLKDSFNTAFVTNLCHSIFQSINEGKRILEDMNKELEHHRFGADRERFRFGWKWVPEFHDYHRFFKEIINQPSLGDGSTLFDSELTEQACEIRDKLMAMLLTNDEGAALRELKRLSDYRNYREYEIYKEPEGKEPIALSKYGTGSGGQLETPAYIIRSAAVTSAFKFNEGNTHCRMVLVDEAFSKMDETRSREVINYLTQTLGLQLIFIMPTSKSGPFMDLISHQVVFSKCPTAEKVGELNTRVNVNRSICNQDKIKELWDHHRMSIRHQASLDFMEDIERV